MGSTALLPGKIYKWTLKLVSKVDFKIGVSKMRHNFNFAFSDDENGWAFFNRESQLRHNSNVSGSNYGKFVQEGGTVGVVCDTITGNLSFILDGQTFDNAYSSIDKMRDGDLYPAVACLENDGQIEIVDFSVKNS